MSGFLQNRRGRKKGAPDAQEAPGTAGAAPHDKLDIGELHFAKNSRGTVGIRVAPGTEAHGRSSAGDGTGAARGGSEGASVGTKVG